MNRFRGGDGGEDFTFTPSPIPSDPPSGRSVGDYPEGHLEHFSKKIGVLTEQVKARSQELYAKVRRLENNNQSPIEHISSNVSIPKGLYRDGDQIMWKGLPVPRIENLNGVDYYINLDRDNTINIIDSRSD